MLYSEHPEVEHSASMIYHNIVESVCIFACMYIVSIMCLWGILLSLSWAIKQISSFSKDW